MSAKPYKKILATVAIPLGVSTEVPADASVEERQEAVYRAAIQVYPHLEYYIQKMGIISDSDDEEIIE